MTPDEIADRLSDQEDAARKRLDRATKAKQLLESGLVKDAFDEIEAALIEKIANAPLSQNIMPLREKLDALKGVRKLIKRHIENGKLAEKDLEHIGRERRRLGLLSKLRRVA